MPLRILLDATAVPAERGGVGRYIDDLLPALVDRGLDVVVAAQERDAELFSARAPQAEVVGLPSVLAGRAARLAWEQTGLDRLARKVRAQVLHSPHYTMPRFGRVPCVVTAHDATFFTHPELHGRVKARFFRRATRIAVRRAAAVVVPSRATATEIARHTGTDVRRLHVAYHGVDLDRFHPTSRDEQERVAASLGLEGRPYVGFLGTLEPRKNVPALVRAWVSVATRSEDPPALVLAGARGWDADVDRAVAAVPDSLTLVRTGYLPLDDLPGFLAGATVLAYPSLGEGFGLPVLEAMACGASVLTTRELSLPEVGGDAVAYSGTSVESIASGLAALLADGERRAALGQAAALRAQGFTWAASAEAHEAAYVAAAAGR